MKATSSYTGANVLVTGASGFLGTHLTSRLVELGANVACLVRDHDARSLFFTSGLDRKVHLVHGNLEDPLIVARIIIEEGIDTVFHLGAQSLVTVAARSPARTFESNIMGTVNVLEACRVHGTGIKRVIVASSDKVYGQCGAMPVDETRPIDARFPYDVSKACVDVLARCYHHTYGLPVVVTRCSNLFGAGDLHFDRLIPSVILSAWRGEPPRLRSNGEHVRDYLHVDDAVEGYLMLGSRAGDAGVAGEAFNFSLGIRKRVLDVVFDVLGLMEKSHLEPVVLDEASGEIPCQVLDCSKARNVLGWQPRVGFKEGLVRTIEWYTGYLAQAH